MWKPGSPKTRLGEAVREGAAVRDGVSGTIVLDLRGSFLVGHGVVGTLDLEVTGFLGGQDGTVDVDVIAVTAHRRLYGGFDVYTPTVTGDGGLGGLGHAVVVLFGDRHLPVPALLGPEEGGNGGSASERLDDPGCTVSSSSVRS